MQGVLVTYLLRTLLHSDIASNMSKQRHNKQSGETNCKNISKFFRTPKI